MQYTQIHLSEAERQGLQGPGPEQWLQRTRPHAGCPGAMTTRSMPALLVVDTDVLIDYRRHVPTLAELLVPFPKS
jgi:hypothetical protein